MHGHDEQVGEGAPSASAQTEHLAAARALIANDLQQRMEACAAEIHDVLARHGMRLEATPAQITLTPAD